MTNIMYISVATLLIGNVTLANANDNPVESQNPKWSPDGRFIAYESDRNGNFDIFVYDTKTKENIQLTDNPADERVPDWSPDGKKIAYASYAGETGWSGRKDASIYIMNADGGDKEKLTSHVDGGDTTPNWSPNGQYILYHTEYAYDEDGRPNNKTKIYDFETDETRYVEFQFPEGDIKILNTWVNSWSPDSKEVLFNTDALRISTGKVRFDIYRADITTGVVGVISEDMPEKFWPFSPDWSHDGQFIIFTRNMDLESDGSTWSNDIVKLDLATYEMTQITRHESQDWKGDISPDGKTVAFNSYRDGTTDIFLIDIGEDNPRKIID